MTAVLVTGTSGSASVFRVCAEFNVQSLRFEVVEVDAASNDARSTTVPMPSETRSERVAEFSIDGRCFVVRRKGAPVVPSFGSITHRRLTKLLTARETQIIELVASGLRNKQIASQLQLSEYTVAAYIKQIGQKLDVHNRTAIAACWLHDTYQQTPR